MTGAPKQDSLDASSELSVFSFAKGDTCKVRGLGFRVRVASRLNSGDSYILQGPTFFEVYKIHGSSTLAVYPEAPYLSLGELPSRLKRSGAPEVGIPCSPGAKSCAASGFLWEEIYGRFRK